MKYLFFFAHLILWNNMQWQVSLWTHVVEKESPR
jgi:hypothetical protein